MSLSIMICDDSRFARKQVARALPQGLADAVLMAADGAEALRQVDTSTVDLILLDLNMPVMDGYAVLAALQGRAQRPAVIVISGDVQPAALARVRELGAAAFLRKPLETTALLDELTRWGWTTHHTATTGQRRSAGPAIAEEPAVDELTLRLDRYRELVNVAAGQVGVPLSRRLGAFIQLEAPRAVMLEPADLEMTLLHATGHPGRPSITQSVVGRNLNLEVILTITQGYAEVARLLDPDSQRSHDEADLLDFVMDLFGLIVGTFVHNIRQQLDVSLSLGHPERLGHLIPMDRLVELARPRWEAATLAITTGFAIESREIGAELLFLLPASSLPALDARLQMLD